MIQLANPSEFKSSDIPTNPGVYLYKDEAGEILYIGKAKNLRSRVKSYFSTQGPTCENKAAGSPNPQHRLDNCE